MAKCDAPHVFLANLAYKRERRTKEDVRLFAKTCGSLDYPSTESAYVFRVFQDRVREAWRSGDASILWVWFKGLEKVQTFSLSLLWKERGFAFAPRDLRDYINLLLTRDILAGRAKFCKNPRCRAPYFIAERSDAQFCSHECASAISVERFRKKNRRTR